MACRPGEFKGSAIPPTPAVAAAAVAVAPQDRLDRLLFFGLLTFFAFLTTSKFLDFSDVFGRFGLVQGAPNPKGSVDIGDPDPRKRRLSPPENEKKR